ncbi:MAG: hypothetical protein DRZ90_16430 [Spirochaetes bacterium]|nr:MAG: hypothetical protein DRP60_07780 [Spirochaetota bacterium]RKX76741.1 MAG: hypothetical protein DRP49_02945 [Spirochaetota bacterium]RKX90327.1 MAG: hypothetical protein DRZ90_16430 [Spirochaetota bacterium]
MNQAGENPSGWRINTVSEDVIFIVGYGDWKEQDARGFCGEYRSVVESFGGKPWAVVGDATEWGFNDAGVQSLLRDHDRWIVANGCRAACFYTGEGALNRLMLYRLAEPDSDKYRFRVYPHRAKAVEALEAGGFSVTDKQLGSFFRGEGTRI